MAKFKAPKPGKAGKKSWTGAVPCLVFVITIFGLMMMLFYWGLTSQ